MAKGKFWCLGVLCTAFGFIYAKLVLNSSLYAQVMFDQLDRIAAPEARPIRLGLLGFAVTIIGALFGFSIDYGPGNPLAYLAFAVVALGVLMGVVETAWGWISIFLSFRRNRGDARNAP